MSVNVINDNAGPSDDSDICHLKHTASLLAVTKLQARLHLCLASVPLLPNNC